MIVIAVVNSKGGTGKTTLASALSVRAAKDSKRVAMVDLDPQKSLIAWWQRRGKTDKPNDIRRRGDCGRGRGRSGSSANHAGENYCLSAAEMNSMCAAGNDVCISSHSARTRSFRLSSSSFAS